MDLQLFSDTQVFLRREYEFVAALRPTKKRRAAYQAELREILARSRQLESDVTRWMEWNA